MGGGRNLLRRSRSQGIRHTGWQSRAPHRTGSDGTHPDGVVQASDRRGQWLRRRRWPRTRAVVRPPRGGGERHHGGVLPPVGRPVDRRRHDPAAPPDRPEPRHGHDPHRPRCRRQRGARDGTGQPRRPQRPGAPARRGAGGRARGAAATVHAIGPIVGAEPVGDGRIRRAGLRIRQHLPRGRRIIGRCKTFRRRRRPSRRAALSPS